MSAHRTPRRRLFLASVAVSALAATAASAQETIEEIVVTGSRLSNAAAQATQPVQVITAEALAAKGDTQLSDALDRIPALIASGTQAQNLANATPRLDLRGLGSNRTLVLVDGRRHVSGDAGSAAVDISSIPSGLVERVEVLTGGASAVYGSDAVTGVVNFILKKDFEGTEFEAQAGTTEKLDGTELFLSFVHGRNFADGKGNVTVSAQVSDRKAVLMGDRKGFRDNRRANDYSNPALFFQVGDPLPSITNAGRAVGQTILLANGTPRFAGTPQALIDRARGAPARAFLDYPTFFISANTGLIGIDPFGIGFPGGPGDFSRVQDLDGNGVDDCQQSRNGRTFFGCWVTDAATGQVRPFRDGVFAGSSNQFGGDGAAETYNGQSLTPDDKSLVFNVTANYEVSSHFKPFVELKAVKNKTISYSPYNTFDDATPISLDNPFIPAAIRALVNAEIAADPSVADTIQVTVARDHADIFDPRQEFERETYRAVAGFTGAFDNGWSYEVSGNYGRTEQEFTSARRLEDRFFAAIDAVVDPATGRAVCRSSLDPTALPPYSFLTDTANYPGNIGEFGGFTTFNPRDGTCAPLNLFGANMASDAAKAFLNYYGTDKSKIEQYVATAFLRGDTEAFFSLPGGPVEFVVGAEYRKEKSAFTPDPYDAAGSVFQYIPTAAVSGSFNVKEAFGEISFPLLRDFVLAKELSVNVAGRISDYSTVGTTETYKVDGVWAPVADIRLRAGYATTVRAPNIVELFSPLDSATFRPIDPCDANELRNGTEFREANCRQDLGITGAYTFLDPLTARFSGQTGGNPDLQEEKSKSYTIGAVIQPRWTPGFVLTADYWHIKIEDAISAVSAQDIVNSCYDAPSLDNQYCALFTRNRTAGSPTFLGFNSLRQTQLNFSGLEASGVDFSATYRFDFADFGGSDRWGGMTLAVQGTWTEKRNDFPFVQDPDRANPELYEINFPKWALNTTVQWRVGDFTASLFSNYLSRQAYSTVEVENAANFLDAFAGDLWIHDVSLRWDAPRGTTVTVGVKNLTNEQPYLGSLATPVNGLGRFGFVRLNVAL